MANTNETRQRQTSGKARIINDAKPARGMRDFLPADIRKRNYVINIIKEVYESYGFEPLETPAVENLETLTGKYGEEGNQLMFKILKRGEKLDVSSGENLADLALRYDLTVPLARVVANYRHELPRFFKRYQIQPVWRADRPARGRFREFYQCDVDAIGSDSMIVEAELISAVCEVLERLGFKNFSVLLNHREILRGVLEVCEIELQNQTDALVALDKLDKIGKGGVLRELKERGGFTKESIGRFGQFTDLLHESTNVIGMEFKTSGDEVVMRIRRKDSLNAASLESLSRFIGENESGKLGIAALKEILAFSEHTKAIGRIDIFPNLARGLSYYNGAIFEIGLDEEDFKLSLGGGGRYDGLIGMFGKQQIPACGFSLGLERIIVVMNERGMFPTELESNSADVMVTVWDEESVGESLKLANELRQTGLRVLVYPAPDKLGKQFKYADSIGIKTAIIMRGDEIAENKVKVKNLQTGEEETLSRDAAAAKIALLKHR